MPELFDYTAMRLDIMNKGVIYVPPHYRGLTSDDRVAIVKFLTPRGSYGWAWQVCGSEDIRKDEQIAIAERMRKRLLGRIGWFWYSWFRVCGKWSTFTWWLYRGRSY